MIGLADLHQARERIAQYVKRTPLTYSHTLSQQLGTNVYLKLELFQKTGSFKPRGAFNKMLQITAESQKRPIIAISGGNFAQGVAYAGNVLGLQTRILMPSFTPQNYVQATCAYGAEVELTPDIATAFAKADEYKQQGWTYLHPFNDDAAVAGYGTVGLEIVADVPQVTDVFVSVGGGGLMTGVVTAVKSHNPATRVWSVETEGADALAQALKAGQVVTIKPTSLAKTLGAPYASADALATAQQHIQQHLVVSDAQAFQSQRFLLERAKILPELAAACTLAAAKQCTFSPENHVVLIMCGGNVSLDDLVAYKTQFG